MTGRRLHGNRPQFKCQDCGALFDVGKPIKESYGKTFYYCPECLSAHWYSTDEMVCQACGGVTGNMQERYCEDCKWIVKQEMNRIIPKASEISNMPIDKVINVIWDIANDEPPNTPAESLVVDNVLDAISHIMYDCNCSIRAAVDMLDEWADGKM